MGSIVTQRPRDCLACRLISGGGLLGAGAYIVYNSRRAKNPTFRFTMTAIALVFGGLGAARLFDLPPFDQLHKPNNQDSNEITQS